MREVIQQVLETEAEAKRHVEAAKLEAEQILAQARQQARQLVERAQCEAKAEAESILESAQADAERSKQQLLARVDDQINAQAKLSEPVREQAIQAVLRCVRGFG